MSTRNGVGGLSLDEVRRVYDRIGRFQDWQGFYESAPVADLIEYSDFESATAVYELGCGTGALAKTLLEDCLGPAATYTALDVSDTMVRLASAKLAPWADRCRVLRVDGALPLRGDDQSYDRFVAAYVVDLLDDQHAVGILEEAHRLLVPTGRLCLVSLTYGSTPTSRAVQRGWERVWGWAPRLVGGCRPVALEPLVTGGWDLIHHRVVIAFGIASEVVVATPRNLTP